MSARHHAVAFGILAALINSSSFAALNDAGKALLEQGKYWQTQNDPTRAAEIWKKLLLIEPQQVDALYGLGLLELRAKRVAGANNYLAQLKKSHPGEPLTLQLEQAIALQAGSNPDLLDQARTQARGGELDKAVALYRQAFAGKPPQGDLAVEFYNYLSYTASGGNEARQGLERLLQQNPNNAKAKLVLAKLLIRSEGTRPEGLRRLAQLSTLPELGGEATESWRQGLVWLGTPRPSDIPLFEAYLKANPNDTEIRKQMLSRPKAGSTASMNPNLARGFKALQNNQLSVAEQAFQARLKEQPQDPDALGGLGLVRQRQGRLSDANELLGRAAARGPDKRWQAALNGNRYWNLLAQADKARAGQDLARARSLLQQAIASNPRQAEGYIALGVVQAEQNQLSNAQSSYQQALSLDSDNPDALLGLITVMAQNGQASQAMQMVERMTPAQQQRLGDLRPLKAAVAVGKAKNAASSGDLKGAITAQQEAIRNDPDNAWTRYDLALFYLKAKTPDLARQTMADALKANPQSPEHLYASALLSSRLGEWSAAQSTLDQIPFNQRTAPMQQLANEAQVQSLVSQASTLSKQGDRTQALSQLRRAELAARGKPQALGMLASAYVDAGYPDHALSMLRNAIAQSSNPPASLRLAYAGVLLKTGDDTRVNQLLNELQAQPLTATDQRTYDDLLFLYTVRQADVLREKGDLVSAYDTLAPALAQRPNDPLANAALARMYLTNGDSAKAIALYKPLLLAAPDDPQLQIGMAQALARSGDKSGAAAAADKALALAPNDAQILGSAAGIFRAQGKNAKAQELYTRALALQAPPKQDDLNPFTNTAVAANPFVGAAGQRRQSRLAKGSAPQIPAPAQEQLAAADAVVEPAPRLYAGTPGRAARTASSTAQEHYSAIPFDDGDFAAQGAGVAPASDPQEQARQAMQTALTEIKQERSPRITQGVAIRSNDSESGLSKMTDVEAPLEINLPVGDDRVALRVTPVSLNAGSVGDSAKTRFGGPNEAQIAAVKTVLAGADPKPADLAAASGVNGSAGRQKDSGVGVSVGYEMPAEGLKADIGVSPLGFLYSTPVGGVSIDRALSDDSNVRYGASVSRRSVNDSLVSFGGAKDARSGLKWGGVTANGGRAQLGYDNGDYGAYGYAGLYKLLGNNVKDNTRAEAGAGIYWYLLSDDARRLTAGLGATALKYGNNQGNFTYGSGGYFSPQNYFSLGVPVSWSERGDRWSYTLRGSVGLQHIEQDSAKYFANDSTMQASLEQASAGYAAAGSSLQTRSSSQNKNGIGYNLGAAAEYRLGSNMILGGSFGMDNAQDYKQWTGGLYLRYTLEEFTGRMPMPINPYLSPYAY
ncbi:cellulose synthase subunit BcsC-related outer membrane protein [Pseudomonas sp. 7P_10.2_Bac1]|uniref:cellulose biosynthesis protein BcsC n=1 Tax=Pseudomonas sp. 7P_10.2_Bac1 TaxID=2971614 RepID=UPI0021C8B22A|nr:cellulose biosynthesis protein BcsC [Pseudomonas sp. 7P_10.2_Bac1]MCU1727125.1 cellulose synthase subunit BcsC-related outer membrane protein [Pseudomonas sp. 7P_10.2_Bac1]